MHADLNRLKSSLTTANDEFSNASSVIDVRFEVRYEYYFDNLGAGGPEIGTFID